MPAPPNSPSMPNRIASTAASELPDEIPSVNGSASGLRRSACSAHAGAGERGPDDQRREHARQPHEQHRGRSSCVAGSSAARPRRPRCQCTGAVEHNASSERRDDGDAVTVARHTAGRARRAERARRVSRVAGEMKSLTPAPRSVRPTAGRRHGSRGRRPPRVAALASTSAGVPRAASLPSAISHIAPP